MTFTGVSRAFLPRVTGLAPGRATEAPWSSIARRCPRTVTILSAAAGDDVHAITVATFGVLSLDPPLVQVTVRGRGRMRQLIEGAGGFAVSILSACQERVAREHSRPGRPSGWAYLASGLWDPAPQSGAPVLRGAAAWLDCGLHTIVGLAGQALVVGAVEQLAAPSAAAPLIRFDGAYHALDVPPSFATTGGGDHP